MTLVRDVHATLDPAVIAARLLDRATTWLMAPAWAVITAEWSGQMIVLAGRGLDPAISQAAQSVAAWVMDAEAPFAAASLRDDERVAARWKGSVFALPLLSRGSAVGTLVALDPVPSTSAPKLKAAVLATLRGLLEPAAGALDAALRLKRAEALSVTDDLTHLYNSRYLNQVLRRETKRASRNGRPLSLLFVDLDGFKSINDTYGHVFGSRALVEAGRVIKGSARETDMVARFGGDEFALILPDTGGPGALAVAERVRERIASHPFLEADGLSIGLTASVGVAVLPDTAISAEELVQAADAAMYDVKARGKNGIQSAAVPADK